MRFHWPLLFVLLLPCACGSPARSPAPALPDPTRPPVAIDAQTTCSLPAFRDTMLRRINMERARRQQCGSSVLQPAAPLVWNERLFSAAARHSADMARRDYFEHANPEGARVGARATAEGYTWRNVGENIAGGDRTIDAVMSGWMRSPSHCSNLMQPDYTEVGVACVYNAKSTWGSYWTMVLGRRR